MSTENVSQAIWVYTALRSNYLFGKAEGEVSALRLVVVP